MAFTVLLLAACGGPPAAPDSPSPVATKVPAAVTTAAPSNTVTSISASESASPTLKALRINLGAYHDNLDPQKAAFVNEIAVLQLAYEGLTRFDPNGSVVPAQAERWTVAPDGPTSTCTLR
ncbi:MAG: peptide ABC transporter substrate-binding protein, partial [Chloroflexota bacterium]|nr:peptide ABC transporter substrate-binding protein [Chloroflexota bacterium]